MTIFFGQGITAEDPGAQFASAYKQSRLGSLLANQNPGERQSRLADLYKVDPQYGMAAQAHFDKMDERTAKQLQDISRMTYGAWQSGNKEAAQSLYGQAVQLAKQVYPGFQVADQLDDATAQMLGQFAGGKSQPEEYTLTPGSARFRGDKQIASVPYQERPQAATFQKDAEGNGWWLRPGEAPRPADGSFGQGGGAQVMDDALNDSVGDLGSYVGGLVSPLGGRITSTTGGQHNPGSKHYSGGAVDIGMGQESPEQQERIIASLESDPSLLVRDERARPQGQQVWGGPHLHVERRQGAPGGRINFGKAETPKFQSRQLTPQEVQQIGLPPGTVAYTGEDGRPSIVSKPEASSGGAKPIPVGALNKVLEAQDALGATQVISDIIGKHAQRIKDNTLPFGPVAAMQAKARTFGNMATEQDANFNEWEADKTKIVNESLRLNKGVQTEGDAQRAVKELMGANDRATAARALRRLAELNNRAVELQRKKMQTIYSNYGRDANGDAVQGQSRQSAGGVDDLLSKYGVK